MTDDQARRIQEAAQLLAEIARFQLCDGAIANLLATVGVNGGRDLPAADRGRVFQLLVATNGAVNARVAAARRLLEDMTVA